MLLLLLAVDFGRLFFTYIQLNNTAREGAGYAAVNPTTDDTTLTAVALREANVQAQRGESAVAATASCVDSSGTPLACSSALGGGGAGNRVTVNVGETFTFFTPLIGNFWPEGLRINTSATAAVVAWAAGGGPGTGGCTAPPSAASFTWSSPDPVQQPNLISVDAGAAQPTTGVNQIVGYYWDFGGPSTDPGGDYLRAGVTQDYNYATGGTYTVKLTVANACGEVTSSQQVAVGTTQCMAPTASFTVSPAPIYKNGKIDNWVASNGNNATKFVFDGSASAFMSDPACNPVWSWSLGNGTASTPTVSGHTYGNSYSNRTVTVSLTVTNKAGTDSMAISLPLK